MKGLPINSIAWRTFSIASVISVMFVTPPVCSISIQVKQVNLTLYENYQILSPFNGSYSFKIATENLLLQCAIMLDS